jgi:hypothetical protein
LGKYGRKKESAPQGPEYVQVACPVGVIFELEEYDLRARYVV